MIFSLSPLALALLLTSYINLATSTPVPCRDNVRDLILKGELPPTACCNYGICDNVSAASYINVRGA